MKNIIFLQARTTSKRFPGKVLQKVNKKTLLEILVLRLKKSKKVNKIVICTTKNKKDDEIIKICKKLKISFFRGDENNVLKRFFLASKKFKPKNIIRITADCPLIDSEIIDAMLEKHEKLKSDFTSNNNPPTFPDGLDVEIFKIGILQNCYLKSKSQYDKEHVTPWMKRNKKIKSINYRSRENFSSLRITLDYYEDYFVIKKIIEFFKKDIYFTFKQMLKFLKKNKSISNLNNNFKRNEGSDLSYEQKLWKIANNLIPGGTSLFSKNPNLFLPNKWPTYYSKTKDCFVWGLDKKKYLDLSYMGVGTNLLGYNNTRIDRSVLQTIKKGNLSTLNSPEEVYLASKFIEMTPWAGQVRFARSGGEANAIALRISRVATKKNKVLFSGYHGWHDWYLASNINIKNSLKLHLMNNVPIDGVPKNLSKNVLCFEQNNLNDFKKKIRENKDIGTVFMEVARVNYPSKKYLFNIRKICSQNKITLIFDECTTGFRECMLGLHNKYRVYPDIAVYGKSLGNGFAINAVVGTTQVMKHANNTFISSTFWTERIGFTAGLKTLEELQRVKPWKKIISLGKYIKKKIKEISARNKININIFGIDSLPSFKFNYKNDLAYRTLLTQEMLKHKILATNAIYVCYKHEKMHLRKYFKILNEVFKMIKKCEQNKNLINILLKSPIRISGIRN